MTAPLTPPDCDLQDVPYMPMYVQRMLNSSFNAMADDKAWRAGVTLWLKSWQQVPAASLPNDDEQLCQIAGFGREIRAWRKVRDKALRGWTLADDGRLYHPLIAEAALEVLVSRLLSRVSSGAGNGKRWGAGFDRDAVEAQIVVVTDMLRHLNPNADGVRKVERRQSRLDPTGTPDRPNGMPSAVPTGSQGKGKGKAVRDAGDDAGATPVIDIVTSEAETDPLGWPADRSAWVDRLIAETGCADPVRDIWPRTTMAVVAGWHETDRFEWRDVVAGIAAVMARKATDPPKSWRYFAAAIARARTDRTTITPEAKAHERPDHFKTAAERNQDSTIAAFQRVFGGVADGEDEPGHDGGGADRAA